MMSLDDDKDRAQLDLSLCPVKAGEVYRHYKGGLYVVIAVSLREDTLEPLVTYRSNARGNSWTRTLANFTEPVGDRPRFSRERG